ncbi:phage integrase SAM-like domain-containing protein [Alistipes sp.]|uniref:phage integrase SAM-like domain-containing protein n=1 Tax=Alistipes sp. TaxID=1872444 RepID=UPI0025C52043|nr:phage integrase SAM-like domain-containing protein [Alistipes sp.]
MVKVKAKIRPLMVKCHPDTVVYVVTRNQPVKKISGGYNLFSDERDGELSDPGPENKGWQTSSRRSAARKSHAKIERLDRMAQRKNHSGNSSHDVVSGLGFPDRENTIFNFMGELIERLLQLNRFGTAKNYRATLGSFMRFRDYKDLPIEAIDSFIMEDYQAYLKSTGITLNSISFYMRNLHAAYNQAVDQNLTEDRRPFRKVFTGVEKTRKRAISIHDVRRIKNLDLPLGSDLELARDLFLFFFSAGECRS